MLSCLIFVPATAGQTDLSIGHKAEWAPDLSVCGDKEIYICLSVSWLPGHPTRSQASVRTATHGALHRKVRSIAAKQTDLILDRQEPKLAGDCADL
jgi:hypothetical protein